MQINLKNLVNFYDAKRDAQPHSNAIKTLAGEELCIALLGNYFKCVLSATTEQCSERATTKGYWLDAWLKITASDQDEIYYQVEVKNWSFHGYGGGKPLDADAKADQTREFKKSVWTAYWSEEDEAFKDPKLNKVLTRMSQFPTKNVKPLACLWAPMHPSGDDEPFFEMNCKSENFSSVSIFSVSSYLRNLIRSGQTILDVELPRTEERIAHIDSIFLLKAA